MLFLWICRNFNNLNFVCIISQVTYIFVVVWSYHGLIGLLISHVLSLVIKKKRFLMCLQWFILIWVSNFNMHSSRAKKKNFKKKKTGPAREPDPSRARALLFRPIFYPNFLARPNVARNPTKPAWNRSRHPFWQLYSLHP
jgi:hypothetical protein